MHYVKTFVSDLRQVGGFLRVLRFPPPIKLTVRDIAEILLKVALNTIKQTNIFQELTISITMRVVNPTTVRSRPRRPLLLE
jgi:hypothetical protein